ncbi:MAG: TetR/AcrR family transcriptional regulator [Chloroflexota bacterium]
MDGQAAPAIARKGVNHRHAGRPRDQAVDAAILRATLDLLAEQGLAHTSIGAVANRAGVARATIYLRWPTRDALLAAAARQSFGEPTYPLSGAIEADVRTVAIRAGQALERPHFKAIFPEIARALLAGAPAIDYDAVAPNRERIAAEYRDRAEAEGFRTDVDPHLPFDMLVGTVLNHVLVTGRSPSETDIERLVSVILEGLRRRA